MNNSPLLSLLQCHSSTPCLWIERIAVTMVRSAADELRLCYEVTGDCSKLRLPELHESRRADELWRRTCAELFMAVPEQHGYFEFNFSPSGEWAAYEFDGYRQGMLPADIAAPSIICSVSADTVLIDVAVNLPDKLQHATKWQSGLSMVIEDARGQCSYWAVAHPCAKPDFHHRDGFVIEL